MSSAKYEDAVAREAAEAAEYLRTGARYGHMDRDVSPEDQLQWLLDCGYTLDELEEEEDKA